MPTVDLGINIHVDDDATPKIANLSSSIGSKLKGALGLAATGFGAAALGAAALGKGLFEVAKYGAESVEEIKALGDKSGLTAGEIVQMSERAEKFEAAMSLMKGTMASWASVVTERVTPVIEFLAKSFKSLQEAKNKLFSTPEGRLAEWLDRDRLQKKAAAEKAEADAKALAEEHAKWQREADEDSYQRYLEDERKAAEARQRAIEARKAAAEEQARVDAAIAARKKFLREAEADYELRAADAQRGLQQRQVDDAAAIAQLKFDEQLAQHEARMAMLEAEKQAGVETARAVGFEFYAAMSSVVAGAQTADQALIGLGQRLAEMLATKLFGIGLDALLGVLGFAVGGPAGAAVGGVVGGALKGIGGAFAEPGSEPRFVGSSSAALTARAERPVQILTVVPPTRAQLDRSMRDSVGPAMRRLARD